MLHKDDFIIIEDKKGTKIKKYHATCDSCGASRGYLSKQNAQKPLCIKCSRVFTEESRKKMSEAKKGKVPWNKGKRETREEVLNKLSSAKRGKAPHNKGKNLSMDQRIKISCSLRGLDIEEFDDIQTPASKLERNKFADMGLHIKAFEASGYKCDCCGVGGVELNAHHLYSWKFFPERRFDVSNLVALCSFCHQEFHKIYGNGRSEPNTEEQYVSFKNEVRLNLSKVKDKRDLIVIAGVSGSGKTWVANNLPESRFFYIPYDSTDKQLVRSMAFNAPYDKVPVYDPTVHVSTFMKRNSDIFNILLVVIQEEESVIASRLASRGGEMTGNVLRRMKRIRRLAEQAVFSSTSNEVLDFLLNYDKSVSPE